MQMHKSYVEGERRVTIILLLSAVLWDLIDKMIHLLYHLI